MHFPNVITTFGHCQGVLRGRLGPSFDMRKILRRLYRNSFTYSGVTAQWFYFSFSHDPFMSVRAVETGFLSVFDRTLNIYVFVSFCVIFNCKTINAIYAKHCIVNTLGQLASMS